MKALILAALVAATPAAAQECIGTADAYASLTTTYGEQRISTALMPDGRIIELWVNPSTQTWSMMVTAPNGVSCGLASGVGFETFPLKPNA